MSKSLRVVASLSLCCFAWLTISTANADNQLESLQDETNLATVELNYLDNNIRDCTRFDGHYRNYFLNPATEWIENINKEIVQRNMRGLQDLGVAGAEHIEGMKDERLMEACRADSDYPRCVPLNAADPYSTQQCRTFKTLQSRIILIVEKIGFLD